MKKFITAIAVSASITAIALAKADKACWIGSTTVWPQPMTFGLQPRTLDSSGGATAQVDNTSYAMENLLTKVTICINGLTTSNYYTNNYEFMALKEWHGSITIPYELLCNFPNNYAQVQIWAYPAGTPVGGKNFTSYAAAKIQGN